MKLLGKRIRRAMYRIVVLSVQMPRVGIYRLLSGNRPTVDHGSRRQPVLTLGEGKIKLRKCILGVWPSPYFFSGYIHLEARNQSASIEIEDDVWINNNAVILAESSRISIGKDTLIGTEFTVYDSDFHDLHPARRLSGTAKTAPVSIGKNVFIGSRVTILKGVTIGDNSVIASGSIVATSIPENSIAAGVPAKVVGDLTVSNFDA